jgi:Ca2+/Na+ antiporter
LCRPADTNKLGAGPHLLAFFRPHPDSMTTHLLLLIVLGLCVVLLTRLLMHGLELLAQARGMSSKTKGQFLGYATSVPEMVGTVGTAGYGLLGAGLWNIASSNIINVSLFILSSSIYGRFRMATKRKFADEIGFALAALVVPLALTRLPGAARSPFTAIALFAGFCGYLYLDKKLNPNPPMSVAGSRRTQFPTKVKVRGTLLVLSGILGIVATGHFLGREASLVVREAGVPEWAVGWILGVITSLPEMTGFFSLFATAKRDADPEDDRDCQEALDSLAASNMSNVGLIYPMGITAFLLATLL